MTAGQTLPLSVREVASRVGLLSLLAPMTVAFENDVERRWDAFEGQVRELLE